MVFICFISGSTSDYNNLANIIREVPRKLLGEWKMQ